MRGLNACARDSLLDFSQHQISLQSPKTATRLKLGRERDAAQGGLLLPEISCSMVCNCARVSQCYKRNGGLWVILVRGNSGGSEDIFAKMLKMIWPAHY